VGAGHRPARPRPLVVGRRRAAGDAGCLHRRLRVGRTRGHCGARDRAGRDADADRPRRDRRVQGAVLSEWDLVIIDAETGAIAPDSPLPGVPALGRFSIDVGRLAWVNPSGQDGQESTVQVLGWSNDDFGEIQTIPARDLYIVR
jgi:hypothetical protein